MAKDEGIPCPRDGNPGAGSPDDPTCTRAQSTSADDGFPTYAHGQSLIRDVCKNVVLPLPLPLCRVLLLDSSSPVISKWESERGDMDFERTPWTFPPATPREMEQFQDDDDACFASSSSDPVTIEVKPLPKIRLSLMPSPREEDEENLDDEGEPPSRKSSQKSSGRSSSKRSSKKSSRNSSNSKRKA